MEHGEWLRQRALHQNGGGPGGVRGRMRFVPPPANYDTPIEENGAGGEGDYALYNEDVGGDPFSLHSTTHGMDTHPPHRRDDDDEHEDEAYEEGYEDAHYQSTMAPAVAAAAATPVPAVPSGWTPRQPSWESFTPATPVMQHPQQWQPQQRSPHSAPQQQSPNSFTYSAFPPSAATSGDDSSPAFESRKRARLSAAQAASYDQQHLQQWPPREEHAPSGSDVAATTAVAGARGSRKRFAKAHQSATNRQIVPTRAVAHNIPRSDEDEDSEQPQQQPHALPEPASAAAPVASSAAPSSRSANHVHSPAFSPQPSSGLSPPSSPHRHTNGRSSASDHHAASSATSFASHATPNAINHAHRSSSWGSRTPALVAPIISNAKPLAKTGAIWVQDYTKASQPVMEEDVIDERVLFLEQQLAGAVMSLMSDVPVLPTLSPVFFTMGFSLLIRQPTLNSAQLERLFRLVESGVTRRLVPAALSPRIAEHLDLFARRLSTRQQAQIVELKQVLVQQLTGTVFSSTPVSAARPSSAAHTTPPLTSSSSSSAASSPHTSPAARFILAHTRPSDEFHMLTSSRVSRQSTCPICGLAVIGATAIKAHTKLCVAKHKEEQQRTSAANAVSALVRQGSRELNAAHGAEAAAATSASKPKRVPALSTSFVPASTSAPAAGTSFSDAISIGDDDSDENPEATVAHISKHQRLSLADSLAFVRASFAADDLIHSQILPLVDPLTLTPIEIPVRSRNCSHVRCMDLAILLQHALDAASRKHKLKCPICRVDMGLGDLVVDSFLELRLKEAESMPHVSEITLNRDCSFDFASAASVANARKNSELVLTRATSADTAKKPPKQIEHVDLLDSADESDVDSDEVMEAAAPPMQPELVSDTLPMEPEPEPGPVPEPQQDPEDMITAAEAEAERQRAFQLKRSRASAAAVAAKAASSSSSANPETDSDSCSRISSPVSRVGFSSGTSVDTTPPFTPRGSESNPPPRSLWNRGDLRQLTAAAGSSLRPRPPPRSTSAPREADIDLTLDSDVESVCAVERPAAATAKIEALPVAALDADDDEEEESADSKTAAVDAMRRSSSMLLRLGLAAEQIERDEPATGVNLAVISPDFPVFSVSPDILPAAATPASAPAVESKEAAALSSFPTHPPSMPSASLSPYIDPQPTLEPEEEAPAAAAAM